MPCAALMGWCKSTMKKVPKTLIPSTHIYWIGVRDLDDGEIEMAIKHKLKIFSTEIVNKIGMTNVVEQVIWNLKELKTFILV